MISNFKLAVSAAMALVMWVGSAVAADYPAVTVDLTPKQVSKHVWMIQGLTGVASKENQGFNSNAGFVVTKDGVIVFDALGTPALGAQMLREIRKITDKPIRHLIISHYHSDHFYGAQIFAEKNVPVIAQRWVVTDYLKSDAPGARLNERRQRLHPWVNETSRIKAPDIALESDKTLELGGLSFEIIHAGPAHTPEDLMLMVIQDGVLFAGDLVFSGRVPWIGNADTKGWLAALDKVIALKPRLMIPGHGKWSDQAQRDLAMTRDYLKHLRSAMGAAVEDLAEFDEAYEQTDWSQFADVPLFEAVNRRNAYNTYIQMQREALGN